MRIELHHVGGRKNSPICVSLGNFCCHIPLSNRQQTWDSRWTYVNNSENLKASFIVQGVYELLVQMHAATGIHDYRAMADALPSLIRYYRELG